MYTLPQTALRRIGSAVIRSGLAGRGARTYRYTVKDAMQGLAQDVTIKGHIDDNAQLRN